jgi:glycosyltransferase involved in cell wall biosynthesis
MVEELVKHEDMEFSLLYFDYKYQTDKYLRPLEDRVDERVVHIPYKLLIPAWRRLSFPHLEMIAPDCDLLYTNEFYFPPTKHTLVLATIHGLSYRIIPEKIASQFVKSFNQSLSFMLKNADYFVAVSETTKTELVNDVGVAPERIYVVTHGVNQLFRKQENQEEVRNHLRDNFGLNRGYILYVGAIGIHKNILGTLTAYEKISKKLSHDLVLVGPPDSAWDKAHSFVVEKNLSERVHFLGYVEHAGKDLVDLYNGADLFVFPSFYEGWTSPPLEAMACGTPVITSNCSSLPETVGSAAIQIDPNEPDELADAMEKVLSDKVLQSELIKKGFEHVALNTWEKAAAKLVDIFADTLERGPWKS